MVIFHSYVSLPEGMRKGEFTREFHGERWGKCIFRVKWCLMIHTPAIDEYPAPVN